MDFEKLREGLEQVATLMQENERLTKELAEAQRYAVAESSKAHQEIVALRQENAALKEESDHLKHQKKELMNLNVAGQKLGDCLKLKQENAALANRVEELKLLGRDIVLAFELLEPIEIVDSAALNRLKAALPLETPND